MTDLYPYFAYGSNLDEQGMALRAPGSIRISAATLPDWRLTFRGVADIAPAKGREVQGALWMINKDGVRALDRYEGAPSFYEQRVIEITLADGSVVPAMTYVMTNNGRGQVGLPSPYYYGIIERGFAQWGLELDALQTAIRETREEHDALQISHYRERGPKRIMAVLVGEESSGAKRRARRERKRRRYEGMSPATERLARAEDRAARKREEEAIEDLSDVLRDEAELEAEFDRDMGILYGKVIA